jgi:adenosine deaminase CECR1
MAVFYFFIFYIFFQSAITMADIQDHFSRRAALIQEDRSLRRENTLLQSLTEKESTADEIVRRIRAEEALSVWASKLLQADEFPHIFPGMEFLTGIYVPRLRLCML